MHNDKDSENKHNHGVFLSGKYVNLTVLTEEDVYNSNWYDWFNDEDTTMLTQHHCFPNTRKKQLEMLNEINKSENKIQFGICDVSGGPIVGVVSLQAIDFINRKAETSLMMGEQKYRGVKYFIESFSLIIRHGFNSLNLHRIYGGTIIPEIAELMCRTLGFKQEGIFREDVFKNGKYVDVYNIGLFREEFKEFKGITS
ncbi:GNAT family N-acetyltransferase [Thermodesulfobacteriota bacterium]